ncbi:MAG: T9SS type A sorting domain-containing protein [Cyclobacteriaceae bacterium]
MLPDDKAEFKGTVPDFSLAPKTQEDFFNFLFDGFLNIEKEGVYQFRLTSDDGSILNLNDSLLIANDGIHNINTVTSPVMILNAGPQRITLKYFDYGLSDTLLVEYKGPDSNGEWAKIPAEALASSRVTPTETELVNEFDFSMYPNPATHNRIQIQLHTKLIDPVSVLIINPAGGIVYENIIDYESDFEIIPPYPVETGMYIISIRQGGRLMNKKIIIQR